MRHLLAVLALMASVAGGAPVAVNWSPQEATAVTPVTARNGQAVFLRELYSLRRDEDYRVAKWLGFNAVIERGEWTFGPANRAGFWVTEASWYTSRSEDIEAADEARAYRKEPRLIAYNLNDEPDLRMNISPPVALANAAELLHRYDKNARTSVTLAGWGRARDHWPEYAKTVDILRVDPYPLVMNEPLSHVFELVQAGRQAAPGKPVVAILQAWTWPDGPFPSAEQARCMAWQALIAGANGISWFDWNDAEWAKRPAFVSAVKEINARLAGPLRPYLLRGRMAPPVRQDDLLAGLWTLPGGDWLILATRLGENSQPLTASFRLPLGLQRPGQLEAFGANAKWSPDGQISVTLPPLGTVAVTTPGPVIRPIVPVKPTRFYDTDWAGRPWRPSSQAGGLYSVVADPSVPFMAAGLGLSFSGLLPVTEGLNASGPVFRAAPGTVLNHRLTVSPGTATDFKVRLVGWQDHSREITGEELGRYVSLGPTAVPDAWTVSVHLPADRDYDASRDHLLTFELSYRHEGHAYSDRRVVRFRLEPAASLSWKWLTATTGEAAFEPTLEAGLYAVPPEEWSLSVSGEGVLVQPLSRGARTLTVSVTPAAEAPADKVLHLQGSVKAGGIELAGGGLDSYFVVNGQLERGETHEPSGEAGHVESMKLTGPWEQVWSVTRDLKPCTHFLYQGTHGYTGWDTAAWFAWDDTHLYWFMRVPLRWYTPQAETKELDSSFQGDDVAFLMLETAPAPEASAYMIQLNAKGVSWQAQVAPSFDLGWTPRIASRHEIGDSTWRFVAALRWSDFGLDGPPRSLRMNVGVAQSIAPRIRATWHYWGRPFRAAESLGTLSVR